MTLADARPAIVQALGRMNAAYAAPVFNEWVLVTMRPEGGAIVAYEGPRAANYKQQFARDLHSMWRELAEQKLGVGDFVFATAAEGTHYDACLRVGETSYLFCNDTDRTMEEIRATPLWIAAQKHWVELSEKFAVNPLE